MAVPEVIRDDQEILDCRIGAENCNRAPAKKQLMAAMLLEGLKVKKSTSCGEPTGSCAVMLQSVKLYADHSNDPVAVPPSAKVTPLRYQVTVSAAAGISSTAKVSVTCTNNNINTFFILFGAPSLFYYRLRVDQMFFILLRNVSRNAYTRCCQLM